jgi:alpha-L-fucosidase 2
MGRRRCRESALTNLGARGGFEIDITWQDGKLTGAVIRSKLGTPCTVRYAGNTVALETRKGGISTLDGSLATK